MGIFKTDHQDYFDQGRWESMISQPGYKALRDIGTESKDQQFILFQLAEGDKRVLNTTEVIPKLQGADKPDINMQLDFEAFKIGSAESIDKDTKATLAIENWTGENKQDKLDKLFYCINAGLDLYNNFSNKKSEAKDFRKPTAEALGNKPISMPAGTGQISLQVVKHKEPKWWQRVFGFAKSKTGQDLMSLIGLPGVTQFAIDSVSGMLDNLFDKEPEILFQSQPIKLAFSQAAKEELGGGISSISVSCLNPGFWVMARRADYDQIINNKPLYYTGPGLLAPQDMPAHEISSDANPFSAMTYAIIRARMKEIDLNQGLF